MKNANCTNFCGNTFHSDAVPLWNVAYIHPFSGSCCGINGLLHCGFLYLRKRTDEKDAKDAALQKRITNWRKVQRRRLRSDVDSDGMFDTGGIIQDLRLSQEEDEQFCEEKHEIEELEIQINLWNRIGDAFKKLLNSCVILACLLALSSFIAFAYSYVCRLWE